MTSSFNINVKQNLTFSKDTDATLSVAAVSGTDTVGKNITISGGQGTGTGAGGSLIFQTADGAGSTGSSANDLVTKMTILDNGNVGIGITAPVLKTQIHGTHGAPTASGNTPISGILRLSQTSGTLVMDMGTLENGTSYGGWIQSYNHTAAPLNLFLNPNGGNVGIGTTSPAGKLSIYTEFAVPSLNGTVTTNNNAGIDFYTGQTSWATSGIQSGGITPAVGARIWYNPATYNEVGSGDAGHHGRLYLTCGHDAATSDNTGICVMSTGNVGIGYNYGSMKLVVNGQTYSSSGYISSDDRIKYNEQVINTSSALSLINQLNPQQYEKIIEEPYNAEGNWIPTDQEWITKRDEKIIGTDGSETNVWKYEIEAGLIAQDIRQIPEFAFCVNGDEIDENGKQQPLRLDYNNISAYHIAATKELTTQLNAEKEKTATQQTQIADLLARVTALENP